MFISLKIEFLCKIIDIYRNFEFCNRYVSLPSLLNSVGCVGSLGLWVAWVHKILCIGGVGCVGDVGPQNFSVGQKNGAGGVDP